MAGSRPSTRTWWRRMAGSLRRSGERTRFDSPETSRIASGFGLAGSAPRDAAGASRRAVEVTVGIGSPGPDQVAGGVEAERDHDLVGRSARRHVRLPDPATRQRRGMAQFMGTWSRVAPWRRSGSCVIGTRASSTALTPFRGLDGLPAIGSLHLNGEESCPAPRRGRTGHSARPLLDRGR